jgi:AraC-like DNA-binding protein
MRLSWYECEMAATISTSQLPTIDRAGNFPLLNPVFDFTYRNPTNAIHLYDYRCRVRVNSKEYAVSPGDITCIQSGSVYSIASDAPGKHWCIHYGDEPVEGGETMELPVHFRLGANSLFYREQIQHISRLNRSIEISADADLVRLEASFRLKALLLALHNLFTGHASGKRSHIRFSWDSLLGWVDDSLNRPISVAMLADRANVAPGTLARKFKQAHKTTLSQYLLHRRIDKAKSLLATTTLTIYEVGVAVGISDPQYFNKQFRKVTATSPSRYRDDNREYLGAISNELALKDGQWRG